MAEHFNQLTPAQLEAISLVCEECGEAQQAVGKILRHGLFSRNPFDPESLTNLAQLKLELGDILAAIHVLERAGLLTAAELEPLKQRKLQKLPRFLHHIRLD